MKVFGVFTILCYWFCFVYGRKKLSDFVNICKRTDPNLSDCWRQVVNDLKPHLIAGIPEFNLPSVEPFVLDHLGIDITNSSRLNFNANATNLIFYGGGNYDVPYTKVDLTTLVINQTITFPKITFDGDFKAKGRALIFDFDGDGTFIGKATNIKLTCNWYFKIIKKNGKEHFVLDREDIDVGLEKVSFHVYDLFKDNPQLMENVNNAINENVDYLYKDFKPLVSKAVSTVLHEYINRVFNMFPYDVVLPSE